MTQTRHGRKAAPRAACALCLAALVTAGRAQPPDPIPPEKPRPEFPRDKKGFAVVPMFFPVLARVKWPDTFAPNGEGGRRRHHGQDLMAPKMTPLVACFDGVVSISYAGPGGHHMFTIVGDNGYRAFHCHVNNDRPGVGDGDDGMGEPRHAFVPGLRSGDRVRGGQLIGYVGDSGNAENTGPHCHFELAGPEGCINPDSSLRRAQRLTVPRAFPSGPDWKPEKGEVRWDGAVYAVDAGRGVVAVDLSSVTRPNGKVESVTGPRLVWLTAKEAKLARRDDPDAPLLLSEVGVGQPVTAVGQEGKQGKPAVARLAALSVPPAVAFARTRPDSRPFPGDSRSDASANASRPEPPRPAPDPDPEHSEAEAGLVRLVNALRREENLPELAFSPKLLRAARRHARDMADNNLSGHVGADRTQVADRVAATGYEADYSTQQVARGPRFPNAQAFYDAMLRSGDANRANLLDPRLREIGVAGIGYTNPRTGEREYAWTLVMAARYPTPVPRREP